MGGYITVTVVMRYAQLPLAQLDSSCILQAQSNRPSRERQPHGLSGEHISSLEDRFRKASLNSYNTQCDIIRFLCVSNKYTHRNRMMSR